jgi:hypothetical protein
MSMVDEASKRLYRGSSRPTGHRWQLHILRNAAMFNYFTLCKAADSLDKYSPYSLSKFWLGVVFP